MPTTSGNSWLASHECFEGEASGHQQDSPPEGEICVAYWATRKQLSWKKARLQFELDETSMSTY
jgi:hypothetical protein